MRILAVLFIIVSFATVVWWQRQTRGEIRYVALGDSYTFGQEVVKQDGWPEVLTRDLQEHGVKIKLAANLAGTGKATNEVVSEQLPELDRLNPNFVTLLVGANDVNRGYSSDSFAKNLTIILDRLKNKKVLLVTTPDFSATPKGKTFGDAKFNSSEVQKFNKILVDEATKRGLRVVDIFFLSQEMAKDESLMTGDRLHPSAKEYQLWEKEIFPVAIELLR